LLSAASTARASTTMLATASNISFLDILKGVSETVESVCRQQNETVAG
jgi:hypothetical protein